VSRFSTVWDPRRLRTLTASTNRYRGSLLLLLRNIICANLQTVEEIMTVKVSNQIVDIELQLFATRGTAVKGMATFVQKNEARPVVE
jgi:hypothetical protein